MIYIILGTPDLYYLLFYSAKDYYIILRGGIAQWASRLPSASSLDTSMGSKPTTASFLVINITRGTSKTEHIV